MADSKLFARVAAHRAVFFRYTWFDYATLRQGTLRLLPEADQRAAWERDYQSMRETMFFREAPSFDEIMRVIGDFERRFNANE